MNRKLGLALVGIVAVAVAFGLWLWRARTPVTGQPRGERPNRGAEIDVAPRALIDDDPKGALRLEGQVVDADDHPVGGATVVLSSNPPRTATSEADGGFAFDTLVSRPYTLVARAVTPSGIAGPITARLTATSDPVVLKLRAAAKLT